jgi:hypothetical protein
MTTLSKQTTKIFVIASILSCDGTLIHNTYSMDMDTSWNIGQATFMKDPHPQGETFINTRNNNDKRLFLITDKNDPGKYATYPTDRGERLTLQEVPGDGQCGDYALGVSREELGNIIRQANGEDEKLNECLAFCFLDDVLRPFQAWNLAAIKLAACAFKLNVEVYMPDHSSLGEDFYFGDYLPTKHKLINRLVCDNRFSKFTYGDKNAPVIRLLHMGELNGFRSTGGGHYRYLYNPNNLPGWEREKIRLLETAVRQKKEICSFGTVVKATSQKQQYELTCAEIIQLQKEGLARNQNRSPAPVQQKVSPSIPATPMTQVEVGAAFLAEDVAQGASYDDMVNVLYKNGWVDKQNINHAINLARSQHSRANPIKMDQTGGFQGIQRGAPAPVQQKVSPASLAVPVDLEPAIAFLEYCMEQRDLKPGASTTDMSNVLQKGGLDQVRAHMAAHLFKSRYDRAKALGCTVEQIKMNAQENKVSVEDYLSFLGV